MSIRRKIYISSFSLKGGIGVRIPALGLPKDLLDSKFIIQGPSGAPVRGKLGRSESSGGTWKPGQCGNPKGRPKGTRDKRSKLRDGLLKEVPGILKTLVAAAKKGDIQAAKLILERTLPALKSAAETLTLSGADTPANQGRMVLGACAKGDISPDEAATLMQALSAQVRIVEAQDLTQRVAALEEAVQGRLPR